MPHEYVSDLKINEQDVLTVLEVPPEVTLIPL
jgi:hypothetical protein